jgi:type IV pilus assembly protein PilA
MNKVNISAKEMAAKTTIARTIHTAQTQYMSQYGRFAQSLQELGPPTSGAATQAAADLLPGDLAKGDKGGYKYTVTGTAQGYQVNAEPTSFGVTGSHTYYSDQSLVIHEHAGQEPATATDPEIK